MIGLAEQATGKVMADRIDQMTEFVLATLMANGDGWRRVVRGLATRWPEAPALEMVVALSAAAEALGDLFLPTDSAGSPTPVAWRLAALVACDIHMAQRSGRRCDTAGDLLAYWRAEDRYFLDL